MKRLLVSSLLLSIMLSGALCYAGQTSTTQPQKKGEGINLTPNTSTQRVVTGVTVTTSASMQGKTFTNSQTKKTDEELEKDRKAEEWFKKAEKIDQENRLIWIATDQKQRQKKEKIGLLEIKYYTKAIEINPDYVEAYFKRANTYELLLDNYQKAIDDYTKVIELKPDYPEAYRARGRIYGDELHEYQKAIDDYTNVIALKPDNSDAYFNRAKIFESLDDYHEAIDDYTKVIELKPDDGGTYFSHGYYYDDAEAYNALGHIYSVKLHEYQEAIDDFTKAIELTPANSLLASLNYFDRGNTYKNWADNLSSNYESKDVANDNYYHAIDDYTEVIKLDPAESAAYYNRGLVYWVLDFPTTACDDFYNAGLLYLKHREKTEALKCADLIKEADRHSPLIKKLMSKIYSKDKSKRHKK